MQSEEKKAEVEKWLGRFEMAEIFRKQKGCSDLWPSFRNYYRGEFNLFEHDTEGVLPLNVTFSTVRSLIPRIYFKDPFVLVTPKPGHSTFMEAKVVEGVVNDLIERMKLKGEVRSAILDCILCGVGVLKHGFSSEFGLGKKRRSSDGGKELEYKEQVRNGMPWSLRLDPDFFIVPFGTHRLGEARWCAHKFIRPIGDVREDKKYDKKLREEVKGAGSLNQNIGDKQELLQRHVEDDEPCVLWEVHDKKDGKVFIIGEGLDDCLAGPINDKLMDLGLPFTSFAFNEDPEWFWAPSDAKIIEPQQLELNDLRTQMMYHRRIALAKLLFQEGMIDEAELEKLLSEDVGVGVMVKGKPKEVVDQFQQHIPPELIAVGREIRDDVRELTGLPRQATGGELDVQDRMTATRSAILDAATESRTGERRDIVGDAIEGGLRRALNYSSQFWGGREIVQVVGLDGARYWIDFSGELLKNEYKVKLDSESMAPPNKRKRVEEMIQLVQALRADPRVNLQPLLLALTREFGWPQTLEMFPYAQQPRMGAGEFMRQQQALGSSPGLASEAVSRNLPRIEGGVKNAAL